MCYFLGSSVEEVPALSGETVPRVIGYLVATRNTGCYPCSLFMTTMSETDEDETRMSWEGVRAWT